MDPFGQLTGVSSSWEGSIREVSSIDGEPNWSCCEARVVVVGVVVVVGMALVLLEPDNLLLEE